MKRPAYQVWIGVLALWIVGLLAAPAHAVIPSALGPMQALIAILPHLIVLLGAAFVAVLKPSTYRALLKYCWAHKGLTLTAFAPVVFLVWGGTRLFGSVVQEQLATVEWSAFRGGPERCGSVPDSSGPSKSGHKLWNYIPASTAIQAIDSSPTVIGNRVYFGLSAQSMIGKSGAIECVDTDGKLVWRYTGEGELSPTLQPVFSSPAVGGEYSDAVKTIGGKKPVGRYLLTGEGYHVEKNSRMICLDLEPITVSKSQPKLHWAIATTSHVEASPCMFEGKAYFGAGDDGVWCIDIASGKVLWHLDGASSYYVSDGPHAEKLAKLAGTAIAAYGTPKRHWIDEAADKSAQLLDVKEFAEAGPKNELWNPKFERTVFGKVALADPSETVPPGASRVKLAISEYFADAESPPVALRVGGEPRLFFGSGIDGQSVSCVHAETGKLIWRTKTAHPAFTAPSVAGDKVFLGLSNGTYVKSDPNPAGAVLCLNVADGKELWQVKTADGILGAVAVKDGAAYACARDGNLYVIDVKSGALIKTYATGAPMVCSPAVTDSAIYMGTNAGKIFCVNRKDVSYKWSLNLTPGKPIYSSPAISGDKLFIGSAERGLFCVTNDTGERKVAVKVTPWAGTGGNEMRSSVSGETNLPTLDEQAERLWDEKKFARLQLGAPLIACGDFVYGASSSADDKHSLVCVEISGATVQWRCDLQSQPRAIAVNENLVSAITEKDGKFELSLIHVRTGSKWKTLNAANPGLACTRTNIIYSPENETLAALTWDATEAWRKKVGDINGSPVVVHDLVFVATKSSPAQLLCLDDLTGQTIWNAPLDSAPVTPPTISGNKVLIALSNPAVIAAFNLVDGNKVWQAETNKPPVSYLAANGEHVAYLAANNRVYVHKTGNGEQTHTVILGKGAQPPAMTASSLIVAADDRAGGYDLLTSNWSWSLKDQKLIGKVFAPPVLAKEIVWLSTEKMGLINVGARE